MGFTKGDTYVKMKKPKMKKSLTSNWEIPFLFMKYVDNNGFQEQDEGGKIFVIKGKDEKIWDRLRRDPQVFHFAPLSGGD